MTLTLQLTPEQEARLLTAARLEGIDPAAMALRLVTEHLPALLPEEEQTRRVQIMHELVAETERLGLYR